jgi:hypothetical protein
MTDAALVTYMDIPDGMEDEFNDWYTNEHVAERVDLAGFWSAFRYQAIDAQPKYFAFYETRDLGALTDPTYKAILADQSDWSKKVMGEFQSFGRMCGERIARVGRGHGGVCLAVRVKGGPGLDPWLTDVLTAMAAMPRAVGGSIWRADVEATGDAGVEGLRLLVLEALDERTLREAAATHLLPGAFGAAGASEQPAIGFYRLISSMQKIPRD